MKNPMEQRWISQFIVQIVNIQWKISTSFVQKLLNLHRTSRDSYVVHRSFVFGRSIIITEIWFSFWTMYGLGISCVSSSVVKAKKSPLRIDLKKNPSFTFPQFDYVPLGILDSDAPPMPFEFLVWGYCPSSLKFNMMVDDGKML